MKALNFPGCCTATIVNYLGSGDAAVAREGYYKGEQLGDGKLTRLNLLAYLKARKARGDALVVVTTNNRQKEGNKILLDLGFKHGRWVSKGSHPETKTRLWWFELDQLGAVK